MERKPIPKLKTGVAPGTFPRVGVTPAQAHDAKRGSAASRGYGSHWRRLREVILQAEPLCRVCLAAGVPTPASDVDHIRPLRDGGDNSRENLQALCVRCHEIKTARDVAARKRHF